LARYYNCKIFVIGGQSIYKYFLPLSQNLYITHIHEEYPGDVYFPKMNFEYNFKQKKIIKHSDFDFIHWIRKKKQTKIKNEN
jgi:dihydrofolate reductase